MPPSPVTVTAFPAARRFLTQGGRREEIPRLSRKRGRLRARTICPRSTGIIAWSYCSPIAVNPGADGILDALEKLSDQAKSHGQLERRSRETIVSADRRWRRSRWWNMATTK